MDKLLLSSAVALMLAAPAFAADNAARTNQTAKNAVRVTLASGQSNDAGAWIQVTSADHLVGRDVRSKDGKRAGED